MKKFIVCMALLMAASVSDARVLYTMDNEAGGKIKFTDTKCRNKSGDYIVFSTLPSGEVHFGCYTLDESDWDIYVEWSNGEVRIYNPDGMEAARGGQK